MKTIIELTGKTVVITGAASGIGKATAILFSELGARLLLIDISDVGLDETMHQLDGQDHRSLVLDLSRVDEIQENMVPLVDEMRMIDGFVHCAGISSRKPLNVLRKEGFSKLMDINFFSFVEMLRLISRKRYFNNSGSIVVMSSISSIRGYKAKAEYCVSKAAVDAFVRCMALELSDRRIRVNSIMPAVVNTPLSKKAKEMTALVGADSFDSPLGPSDPEEVANLIAFLISNATRTITGTSICIDGGACI